MQKTIVVAAAAFLASAGVCLAQPAGVTREMISRALPLEGAPKAEPGPYQVTSEPAFGSPGLQVYRPAALDAFPKKDTLPVMVWGNGGCGIDSKTFCGFSRHRSFRMAFWWLARSLRKALPGGRRPPMICAPRSTGPRKKTYEPARR